MASSPHDAIRMDGIGGEMKHIFEEGSREHVLWWDGNGRHCSEKDCEINFHRREIEGGGGEEHGK